MIYDMKNKKEVSVYCFCVRTISTQCIVSA